MVPRRLIAAIATVLISLVAGAAAALAGPLELVASLGVPGHTDAHRPIYDHQPDLARPPSVRAVSSGYDPSIHFFEPTADGRRVRRVSSRLGADRVAPTSALDDLARVCRSFSADTEVLMADGTTKPISVVQVGDEVWALDPETGEAGARFVTAVWPHEDMLLDFKVEGGSITTTEDHHFWNASDSEWQETQDIDLGDNLVTADGDLVAAGRLNWASSHAAVAYDLTVDDVHTYFVVAGDDEVLVHNTDCFPAPNRVVNSNMAHAEANAVERAGFGSVSEARSALQALSTSIKQSGFPAGTIADTARANRVLVPFGDGGLAVYQVRSNGTAVLKTVLEAR